MNDANRNNNFILNGLLFFLCFSFFAMINTTSQAGCNHTVSDVVYSYEQHLSQPDEFISVNHVFNYDGGLFELFDFKPEANLNKFGFTTIFENLQLEKIRNCNTDFLQLKPVLSQINIDYSLLVSMLPGS